MSTQTPPSRLVIWLVPAVAGMLAAAALLVWPQASAHLGPKAVIELAKPVPPQPPSALPPDETLMIEAQAAGLTAIKAGFPGFRGGKGDGIVNDGVKLVTSFPTGGPKLLWSRTLGVWPTPGPRGTTTAKEVGHNGCAVRDGFVYTVDYDLVLRRDMVRCLSLVDGRDVWVFSYALDTDAPHGITRTTVAVDDRHVVTIGPNCHLFVLDRRTGRRIWGLDLVGEYGTRIPAWLSAQSPLIDGDRLIVAPAGKKPPRDGSGAPIGTKGPLIAAYELATGKLIWSMPNLANWTLTHTTVAVMTLGGRKVYVYSASKGVVGVDAADGKLVFDTLDWKVNTATVATPIPFTDGRIFLCGGYKAGSMMVKVVPRPEGGYRLQELYRLHDERPLDGRAIFGSEQHTPILYDGFLYGVRTNGEMVCIDPDTGKERWASGRDHLFGLGPYIIAEGLLITVSDKGWLELARPSPAGYKPLAATQVTPGQQVFAPITMVGGLMLVRDQDTLCCYDLREKPAEVKP